MIGHGDLPIDAIRESLDRRPGRTVIGRRLEHHAVLESTNDRARELAGQGEPEGLIVLAGEQTRGRGRAGRGWHSAPGLGIYLSVLLRPEVRPERVPIAGLAAAVAAVEAVREAAGIEARIKWPNDLVVNAAPGGRKRKLGGILTEARSGPDGVRDLVIGIGLNVNHGPADFPPDLASIASSLRIERGRTIDPAALIVSLITSLDRWYAIWRESGESAVLSAYRGMALDLEGKAVRIREDGSAWEGLTAGLAGDGALMVRRDGASGPLVPVRYGEIERVEEI